MDDGNKRLIEYFQTKEDLTRVKLMLIKIAAMLYEDEKYSKEVAFEDIMNVIQVIEDQDIPVKNIMNNKNPLD
jgi:hypothetical protein